MAYDNQAYKPQDNKNDKYEEYTDSNGTKRKRKKA
jgi:hypothetical protein